MPHSSLNPHAKAHSSSRTSGPSPPTVPPTALSIAGSDSGGGAGLQADLKTFAAHRVHGTTVVTLVTAQNTKGVTDLMILPGPLIRSQFRAVYSDLIPRAAKIGALGNAEVIGTVAELLEDMSIDQLVLDPVMVSKHGDPLMSVKDQRALRDRLVGKALLITPNRFEAETLTGRSANEIREIKDAAKHLFDLGARHVLIKGSHFEKVVRDVFYDGTGFIEFGADRIESDRVHGSGCVYSAAITAQLAKGVVLEEAIGLAREFISKAIEKAPPLGHGISPVHPFHALWA